MQLASLLGRSNTQNYPRLNTEGGRHSAAHAAHSGPPRANGENRAYYSSYIPVAHIFTYCACVFRRVELGCARWWTRSVSCRFPSCPTTDCWTCCTPTKDLWAICRPQQRCSHSSCPSYFPSSWTRNSFSSSKCTSLAAWLNNIVWPISTLNSGLCVLSD